MGSDRRAHWNERYESGDAPDRVADFLVAMADHLPTTGRAIDIGGGLGRNALWLAERGLEVTLVDISDVALDRATARAVEAGLPLRCVTRDVVTEGLPPGGPWDVALLHRFFSRDVVLGLPPRLRPGGILLVCQPTIRNLERHQRPSRRFLVAPGQLGELAAELEAMDVLELSEAWRVGGTHDAWLVARRRPASRS